MERYEGNWNCKEDVARDFETDLSEYTILYASYDTPPYEGYAYVLARKGITLYEVNGSHCSCMGLEGQWSPEEVTPADLEFRKKNGNFDHLTFEEIKDL